MCVNVCPSQPFLFISVSCSLSHWASTMQEAWHSVFLEVRALIFHELSNQAEEVFWQESQRVSQETLAAAERLLINNQFGRWRFGPGQMWLPVMWIDGFLYPIHTAASLSWYYMETTSKVSHCFFFLSHQGYIKRFFSPSHLTSCFNQDLEFTLHKGFMFWPNSCNGWRILHKSGL